MEIKDNIIKVEKIDWIEIQPIQSSKFKEITDLDSLKASIKNEGFSVPFIVWENNGTIYSIDGFHRKLALEQFEQEGIEVPEKLDAVFISANNMKDAAIKLIALQPKAAKITQQGFEEFKTSFEIIDSEVEEYNIEAINMDSEVVNEILEASEDDFDEELPINPITVLGDLYEIGEHRLLCGDSTQTDTFEKLMQGELADMVVTDPPYNVAYEGKTKDALTIENDSMANDDFYKFLYDFYSALTTAVKKGGAIYVWHASSEVINFGKAMVDAGWLLKQQLIWVKNTMVMGRQDYQWKHEPCLYGWLGGDSHKWYSDRKQTTVINWDKPQRNGEHPTMKPIGLFAYQIQNSSKKCDIVIDAFGGSGTTMVACEQTNRKARLVEYDPKYCDVIVKRMLKLDNTLKIKVNGVDETKKWLELL